MRSPLGKVAALSLGRIAVGVVSIARPDIAGQAFGTRAADNAHLTVLMRLFGAREIGLGLVTLTSTGPARRNALLAGIAVDAADATTALIALRDDELPRPEGSALAGIAVGAVGIGVLGLVAGYRAARAEKKARKALAAAG